VIPRDDFSQSSLNQASFKELRRKWGLVEGSVDNLLRESKILHGSKRISSKETDEDQKETFGNLESSRKVVKNTKSDNFCLARYYSWIFRDIAKSINKFKKYALSRTQKSPYASKQGNNFLTPHQSWDRCVSWLCCYVSWWDALYCPRHSVKILFSDNW
jgi:hypothetical protein